MDATLTFMAPATPPDASEEDFNITDVALVAAAAEEKWPRMAPQQGERPIVDWRIAWEYLWKSSRGSGWRDFHPTLSHFVECAFVLGQKSCARQIGGAATPDNHYYRWDFEEWKQYKEIDGRVVATKKIRRVMALAPSAFGRVG